MTSDEFMAALKRQYDMGVRHGDMNGYRAGLEAGFAIGVGVAIAACGIWALVAGVAS